ncbi:ExbD/TolR family protein [Solidesulfovibrio alcoholivorans]|uniref:ExbD/TolR family protein n=1 Tax=Solidesulfovibrio alcoholivorans TaxID=81406 RepID=UPI00049687BA|nr:ExbD/TolR family protein [Solidesulfovibrio alcoholivorans]
MSAGGRGRRYSSDINVTPFVDVMLVLLIIFMVTAPMMTEGLDVDLPRTKTVEALPVDDEHLVVGVDPTGMIFLDEQSVSLDDLTARLRNRAALRHKAVFLRADRGVSYGRIVDIMGHIREAGIDHFGVVAERPEEGAR